MKLKLHNLIINKLRHNNIFSKVLILIFTQNKLKKTMNFSNDVVVYSK